jgi:hypothetical protein
MVYKTKVSWKAELSLFFVSEMVGENLQFRIRRDHPSNEEQKDASLKAPKVVLRDIKCKYKVLECGTMQKYFVENFHQNLFILPNY